MAKGTGKEATGLAGQSAPPAGQCEEGAAAEAASASQCEAAPTPAIPAASSRGRRTEPRASRWWAILLVPTSKLFLKCFLDSYLSSSSLAPNSTKKTTGVTQGCPGPTSHLH